MVFTEAGYGDWATIREKWRVEDMLAATRSLEARAKRQREQNNK